MSSLAARARHRWWHARHGLPEVREELVARQVAGGKSFADIGCMWRADGAIAFAAEAAGAAPVTAADVMGRTPEFDARHAASGSSVRFVQGDLHEREVLDRIGPHDVVWCSGVLYHVPDPLRTLTALRRITTGTLLLATETLPERPRRPRAAVFAPGPGDHPGRPEPLDLSAGYHGWYWLMTGSAIAAMLEATGFKVAERHGTPFHQTFVAHPSRSEAT